MVAQFSTGILAHFSISIYISDQGYRKKAWYLMKAYYDKH